MRALAALLLFSAVALSCSTEKKGDPEQLKIIADYKAGYESNKNSINASKVVNAIIEYAEKNPEDEAQIEVLFDDAIAISMEQTNLTQAASLLNTLIKEYPGIDRETRLAQLTRLLLEMNNTDAAGSLCLAGLAAYPASASLQELKSQINPPDADIKARLDHLSTTMFNDSLNEYNVNTATAFVDACEAYVMANPTAKDAVDYLHQAGQTARSIRTFRKAISLYDWIFSKYPNDPRAGQALFLEAFTYDNELKEIDIARKLYEQFIAKFPKDELVDDAQFLLKNLGKSDDEILQELGTEEQSQ
ncbi:MAG: tetratricopeptide repeat protein [Saprospiraceae bacterium]